ncbi:hypothetical protein [Nocardiopsis suaedae]|uniref:Uncharacterized protein n=1 Tax=Nocardiopsis suaedae TaxID=3018444 RepID=A0ABT4TSB3_9ACTN|nr:hypothetical protein [Nocardiopsis suaedae]MDA2807573.1 hypothetical protein [Nocardiopsis suaedae]
MTLHRPGLPPDHRKVRVDVSGFRTTVTSDGWTVECDHAHPERPFSLACGDALQVSRVSYGVAADTLRLGGLGHADATRLLAAAVTSSRPTAHPDQPTRTPDREPEPIPVDHPGALPPRGRIDALDGSAVLVYRLRTGGGVLDVWEVDATTGRLLCTTALAGARFGWSLLRYLRNGAWERYAHPIP